MSSIIKKVAVFAVGVGIGAFATAIVLKNRYEVIIKEEIDSMKEYMCLDREDCPKNFHNIIEKTEDEQVATKEQDPNSRVLKQHHDRYKRIVRQYNGDTETSNAIAEHERLSDEANRFTGDRGPYVINTEEFSEEMSHFDKLTIYYYEDDDTLTDDNEEILSDVNSIVGDALENFGNGSDDPEVVYVRNERMAIDYEVIRLSKSYKETVLGR